MSYLKDYLGSNEFFKKDAIKVIEKFNTDAYIKDGVVRWKSNNAVPPNEILELWAYVGKDFNLELSISVSEKETSEFLKGYRERMKNYSPSPEEIAEMRTEFGSGTVVIDVITGREIQL